MKLKQLGNGYTMLITNHGDEVIYLQETPVAGYKRGVGFFKNREFDSGEYVSDYLTGVDDVMLLMRVQIENLFGE